jgi:hypothetical protein
VGPLNIALWVGGIVLMAVGYTRARTPYARYRKLGANEANLKRYDSWRGSRSGPGAAGGTTGADLMRAESLRQARLWAAVAVVGFVLVFAGFAVR